MPALAKVSAAAQLQGLRVLLVDDEKRAVSALTMLLSGAGLVAFGVTSGQEALEVFDREQPDVILLDMEMPGMSGLELLQRVRERLPELPAVVMSGYTRAHVDIKRALQAPNVGYLEKPVRIRDVLEMLLTVISRRPAAAPGSANATVVPRRADG